MKLPNFRNLRPTKSWIVLGVALGIGLLAALVATSYMRNRLAEIEARGTVKTINVVVAKRALNKGEVISAETLAVRPIPVDYAHSQALTPDSFEHVEGQRLAYPVNPGEMILWGLIEGKRLPTFSARVMNGRRALTVPVDEINSISGMLEPGDQIDLLASVDKNGKKYTFAVLQGISILATGQRVIDDPKSGEKKHYSTVTLDTTPEQAQIIIRLREAGKLTALLRNPQDKVPLPISNTAALFMRDVTGEMLDVPVLYGGRGGRIPPEGLHLGQFEPTEGGDRVFSGAPPAAPPAVLTNARAQSK